VEDAVVTEPPKAKSLDELWDEYRSIQDPAARAKFYAENRKVMGVLYVAPKQ
jgi:hypothetical protein